MAALSDQLLVVAIMVYLVAMIFAAAQYSFGNRGAIARVAARPAAPAKELVGAAMGGAGTPPPAPVNESAPPPARERGRRFGQISTLAFAVAVLVHLGAVLTRGLAAERMPWGNMYEFVLTVTLVGAVAWLVVAYRRPDVRHLGLYLSLVIMVLLMVDGLILYTAVVPLVPALKSYWFVVHVAAITLASGLFLVGFVPAAMALIRGGYENGRRRFPYSLGARMPRADVLEPLAFRLNTFGFPLWTFAVAAGAVWAEAAWGRYWGWDPKEIWAFITWVVYAGYLHARATPSVKRNVAIWIAIIGWFTVLMNLFGVNLFFGGLHSYAGI